MASEQLLKLLEYEARARSGDEDVEVDADSAAYLAEVLAQEGGVSNDDLRDLLGGVLGVDLGECEEADFDALVRSAMAAQGIREGEGVMAQETEEDQGATKLTDEQRKKLVTLEEATAATTAPPPPPPPPSSLSASSTPAAGAKGPSSRAAGRGKPRKDNNADKVPADAAEKAKAAKAAKAEPEVHEVGEGEFRTKRFERFHKKWAGKGHWKVQGHALADTVDELDDDDYSSAWLECLRLGIPWGGRGAGGRGVQRVTGEVKDIYIPNVTMARDGRQLLTNATLKLNYGARYCLTGRNGSGKTTLLRRIARGALPGFPPYLQVQYVEQELKGCELKPTEYVLRFDFERTRLLGEEEELLERMEGEADTSNAEDIVAAQARLTQVYERLEQIGAWDAEQRAEAKLREVGFTDELLDKTTQELSGGWRMRCALCGTLFMKPDVLLLDEPTNALDALGVEWLKRYLGNRDVFSGTVLLVSHDRDFINTVTDELIVLRKQQFAYFPGTYNEYREMLELKRQGDATKLANMDKRKKEMQSFVEAQQRQARDKKSRGGDPKKQKQIRSRKKAMERMDRHGFGRGDGRKYKQSVHGWYGVPAALDTDEKPLHFKFPDAEVPLGADKVMLSLEGVSYGWSPDAALVEGFSAQVRGGARLGILGPNGVGKSTLVQVMLGELQPLAGTASLHLTRPSVAVFHQDMASRLPEDKPALELILERPRGPGTVNCQTEADAREYLGSFGLGGDLALRPVSTLSGGEKCRVVFALESYSMPQLLLLDEPTAHLDLDSIDVLAEAIARYNGTVVLISHDSAFLAETCSSMWVFDPKTKSILQREPEADQTPAEFVAATYRAFIDRNFDMAMR